MLMCDIIQGNRKIFLMLSSVYSVLIRYPLFSLDYSQSGGEGVHFYLNFSPSSPPSTLTGPVGFYFGSYNQASSQGVLRVETPQSPSLKK